MGAGPKIQHTTVKPLFFKSGGKKPMKTKSMSFAISYWLSCRSRGQLLALKILAIIVTLALAASLGAFVPLAMAQEPIELVMSGTVEVANLSPGQCAIPENEYGDALRTAFFSDGEWVSSTGYRICLDQAGVNSVEYWDGSTWFSMPIDPAYPVLVLSPERENSREVYEDWLGSEGETTQGIYLPIMPEFLGKTPKAAPPSPEEMVHCTLIAYPTANGKWEGGVLCDGPEGVEDFLLAEEAIRGYFGGSVEVNYGQIRDALVEDPQFLAFMSILLATDPMTQEGVAVEMLYQSGFIGMMAEAADVAASNYGMDSIWADDMGNVTFVYGNGQVTTADLQGRLDRIDRAALILVFAAVVISVFLSVRAFRHARKIDRWRLKMVGDSLVWQDHDGKTSFLGNVVGPPGPPGYDDVRMDADGSVWMHNSITGAWERIGYVKTDTTLLASILSSDASLARRLRWELTPLSRDLFPEMSPGSLRALKTVSILTVGDLARADQDQVRAILPTATKKHACAWVHKAHRYIYPRQ